MSNTFERALVAGQCFFCAKIGATRFITAVRVKGETVRDQVEKCGMCDDCLLFRESKFGKTLLSSADAKSTLDQSMTDIINNEASKIKKGGVW